MRGLLPLLLVLPVAVVVADVLPIGDDGYPYLRLTGKDGGFVRWHTKRMALRMGRSQGVRVNARGVRFIPPGVALVNVGGRWERHRCVGATDSLCHLDQPGSGFRTRVFPNSGGPAFVSHGEGGAEGLAEFVQQKCPESETGRTAVFDLRWDLSACNVLGAGVDLVYLPGSEELYVLRVPISFPMFSVIGTLVILLSIILAQNLERTMGGMEAGSSTTLAVGGMLALLFCTLFATGSADILEPYVTVEDRAAAVVLLVYVVWYVCRILYSTLLGADEMASPVNPILATMLQVSLRLYTTLDNPYTSTLTFLITVRMLHKIAMHSEGGPPNSGGSVARKVQHGRFVNWIRKRLGTDGVVEARHCMMSNPLWTLDILMDALQVSVATYVGIVPQHGGNLSVVSLFLLQGFFVAAALNRVVIMFEGRGAASEKKDD